MLRFLFLWAKQLWFSLLKQTDTHRNLKQRPMSAFNDKKDDLVTSVEESEEYLFGNSSWKKAEHDKPLTYVKDESRPRQMSNYHIMISYGLANGVVSFWHTLPLRPTHGASDICDRKLPLGQRVPPVGNFMEPAAWSTHIGQYSFLKHLTRHNKWVYQRPKTKHIQEHWQEKHSLHFQIIFPQSIIRSRSKKKGAYLFVHPLIKVCPSTIVAGEVLHLFRS